VLTPPGSDNLENSFFGYHTGESNREYCNAFFGNYAGHSNTIGTTNSFFGYQAGQNNTTGSNNTFIGTSTNGTADGNDNTVVGYSSNASGSFNTIIGAESSAGVTFAGPGSNITLLGARSFASSSNLLFATAVGAGAIVSSNNTMVLGRAADTVIVPGTLTNPSDARLKTAIADLRYGVNDVMRLRPVTWTWKDRPDAKTGLGLIAQDVLPILPELVEQGTDKDGMLSLNYIGLLPVIVKAIQQQQATITSLRNEVAALQKQNPDSPYQTKVSRVAVSSAANICSGTVTTDANGEATLELPDGFEARNTDFRYQLTVIGRFAQAIVVSKIKGNRFNIKTSEPKVEVSWQVTGVN